MSFSFSTVKVPILGLPLYQLSIRAPATPYVAVDTYIFPLSPSNIRKRFNALSAIYDTSGDPQFSGVTRTVDSYGITPFFYEIEGTTGWDLHQTDGYTYTGLQSIQRIQQLIYEYGTLNQTQRLNNDSESYTLEFSDFFNDEYYQVEPIGPLEIFASDRAPILQYYRLRLAGIAPVASALLEDLSDDPTAQMYAEQPGAATRSTLDLTDTTLSNY